MTEIESLIKRAGTYLQNANTLLAEEDDEHTVVLTKSETEEILLSAQRFIDKVIDYLRTRKD